MKRLIAIFLLTLAPSFAGEGGVPVFDTAISLAGVANDRLPEKNCDLIDRTSFLPADDGESKREAVCFRWGQKRMACRMKECKADIKVALPPSTLAETDHATPNGFGLPPRLFKLHIDPKEPMPVGHRRSPWLDSVVGTLKTHGATFRKYPQKNIGP